MLTVDEIWKVLEKVKDPEIPVVSLIEMGITREVKVEGDEVIVSITPTFSGCPALHAMRTAIEDQLKQAGVEQVSIQIVLNPPWTTDWLTETAREKLRKFGIAPPLRHEGDLTLLLREQVDCPNCGSSETALKNSFGPTPCRTIHYCNHCQQPFEGFKAL